MENKCPKCGINLSLTISNTIQIRDKDVLAMKWLMGEASLDMNFTDDCDLCKAPMEEIVAHHV